MKTSYKILPWSKHFYTINQRCNDSNYKAFKYYGGKGIRNYLTQDELKFLWFRDKAYLLEKPSIDRKDSNGHYTFENCQFIEHSANSKKAQAKNKKSIIQCNLDGKNIKEWDSRYQIEKETNYYIQRCLQGRQKIAYGFIWKYKL